MDPGCVSPRYSLICRLSLMNPSTLASRKPAISAAVAVMAVRLKPFLSTRLVIRAMTYRISRGSRSGRLMPRNASNSGPIRVRTVQFAFASARTTRISQNSITAFCAGCWAIAGAGWHCGWTKRSNMANAKRLAGGGGSLMPSPRQLCSAVIREW